MKRLTAPFLGALLLLASAPRANRVTLSDMGISVWVPSGWVLQNMVTTDSTREYWLDDTILTSTITQRHSGHISLSAHWGALVGSGSTRQWVLDEGDIQSLLISTAPLGGTVFLDDAMTVSGLFAREVFGQSLQATYDSVRNVWVRADSVRTTYVRCTAHGDVGWDFSVESDTSDADTAMTTYAAILDSIQVDTTVNALPPSGIRAHDARRSVSQALSAVGGTLRIQSAAEPRGEAMDLLGRAGPGSVVSAGDGIWLWRPNARPRASILTRVRLDGTVQPRRLVLDP